jgi:hypothetical protein
MALLPYVAMARGAGHPQQKKFFASFFQERRIFFSEEKKQKTFYYHCFSANNCKISITSIG